MKIAVEGCCHGELDKIYETLEALEKKNGYKVDILLICGDFQSVRNKADLNCMAVPPKHRKMNTFYKYYAGEMVAPVLTVFIGGNHEASNYLQALPYGGWVAPNIYYMGYAGVLQFGGIRIGGMSGIYKGKDYFKGHHEHHPYTEDSKRSAYHVRALEVFRLKQITRPVDIFMSHDWPRGIYKYGDVNYLLRKKSFFREEIEKDILGNPKAADLLQHLKPAYWFSAHLHVKFAGLVQHQDSDPPGKITKFLSLDKCLPRRHFLQVIDVPHDTNQPMSLQLDPEWLAILKSTNHMLSVSPSNQYVDWTKSYIQKDEDLSSIKADFGNNLAVPDNFAKTVPVFDPNASKKANNKHELSVEINPQTTLLCSMLELTDPNAVFSGQDSRYQLPEGATEGSPLNDDGDDDIDEDYESEQSFVSVSGSEKSFSDRSFSFMSTGNDSFIGNESFSSLGNPDESIALDNENDDKTSETAENDIVVKPDLNAADSDQDVKRSSTPVRTSLFTQATVQISTPKLSVAERIKLSVSEVLKNTPLKSASASEDESEIPPLEKSNLSISSTDSDKLMLDSSLSGKVLDVGDDEEEIQQMLQAQKTLKYEAENVMEISLEGDDDDDMEFQQIISTQKKNQESIPDIQKDLANLKPVYQSSPAVSIDDRIDENLSISEERSGMKRETFHGVSSPKGVDSPVMKRFRRRNQEMYSDNSTEDEL